MTAYRMGRAAGYVSIAESGKPLQEGDTLQCVHCAAHFYAQPGSGKQRGWCLLCRGPHCGGERCWKCEPFEKKLEADERRRMFLRQVAAG